MIPIFEKPTPKSIERPMQAIEYLHAEKRNSKDIGVTEHDFFENSEEWKLKSEEEKQLCYMNFAERYADYMCEYEKKH